MREDYEPYFESLKHRLQDIGATLVQEDELVSKFRLSNGWMLTFECERYYGPAFGILIEPADQKTSERYEVGLLMQTFESLYDISYGRATIEGQIDFLVREAARVFTETRAYRSEYVKREAGAL